MEHGMKELTDGGVTYPRTRLWSQDYTEVLFDTSCDEGDPIEWFTGSEHERLGMTKDFSESWKTRWGGRIEKQEDGSARVHDASEYLHYMLMPQNPFVGPVDV